MRKLTYLSLPLLLLSTSCSLLKKNTEHELVNNQTFRVTKTAKSPTYGLSPKKAVRVGGAFTNGPLNERRFLNALAGPAGEKISYYRLGSCCPTKSKNGFMGTALIDHYRVTWEGSTDTVSIYINMYDRGVLKAPKNFSIKKHFEERIEI